MIFRWGKFKFLQNHNGGCGGREKGSFTNPFQLSVSNTGWAGLILPVLKHLSSFDGWLFNVKAFISKLDFPFARQIYYSDAWGSPVVSTPHLYSIFCCSGLYMSWRRCSMGKIRPRGTFPRNSFILHWLKVEYFSKRKHFDLGFLIFFLFLKSLTKQICDGEGKNNNNKTGKGQIDSYTSTSGDINIFQKICFPRGRDLDLYRAMLVCNQNRTLVQQTLINYDKQIFFFFSPSKKSLGF